MRYIALVSDYDGTLAHDGVVTEETINAVEHLKHSGRKFILATGRELPDLEAVFPRLDLCDRIVAENGAVLYNPATREKRVLAPPPPPAFIESLRQRGVHDMSAGDVIVATWHPFQQQVMEAIKECGLELQVIFNKDAVMILPSGVNKMTGLKCALQELKLSAHSLVAVGDAENDHAMLQGCECAVAVSNAIPSLKDGADLTTEGARGQGVTELICRLIENDLTDISPKTAENSILIGTANEHSAYLPAYGRNVLVCGQSGSGKSTLVTGLLERIMATGYQICLIDPEGDYENLPGCRTVGDEKRPPSVEHIRQVLEEPDSQVIVNLVGVASSDRAVYFASLIGELQALRLSTGRPHWLVIDEAHHVLPVEWAHTTVELAEGLRNLILVTVHPEHVSPAAMRCMDTVLLVGREPGTSLAEFARAAERSMPSFEPHDLERGQALVWFSDRDRATVVRVEPPQHEHYRHRRKYAEGELESERCFHFRGPDNKMDLVARNLNIFVQIVQGIDAETWLYHLRRGDYSNWLRDSLKDHELAQEVAATEENQALSHQQSRDRVKEAILSKYTAPA